LSALELLLLAAFPVLVILGARSFCRIAFAKKTNSGEMSADKDGNQKIGETKDTTTTFSDTTSSPEERSWNAIVDVVRSKNRKRINAVVFRYISEQCSLATVATTTNKTSEAICALEQRLRSESVKLWCMAHPIAPPQQLARSLQGEPCNYYLLLALSEADRDKFLSDKACTAAENNANLRQTGFQTGAASAGIDKDAQDKGSSSASSTSATKGAKPDYLELPADLHGERDSHFDDAAIRFYDPSLSADLFRRHAKEVVKTSAAPADSHQRETREKQKSKILQGTGVQVVRTSVPTSRWSETRAAIVEQARLLLPIADMDIVGCVREQVIPLGFALHGISSTPLYLGGANEPVCLFDLYCCTVRRYHIDVSQADADVLKSASAAAPDSGGINKEVLHEIIARCAGTVPEEVEHITADRLSRFVCYNVAVKDDLLVSKAGN
jgi:hypothetical protein